MSQQPTYTTKPSNKPTFVILSSDFVHSVHLELEEAEEYLADLRLTKPNDNWDLIDVRAGRRPGHEKKIWCSTGCIHKETRKVINFRRCWAFEGEITPLPEKLTQSFTWLILNTTDANKFEVLCRPLTK